MPLEIKYYITLWVNPILHFVLFLLFLRGNLPEFHFDFVRNEESELLFYVFVELFDNHVDGALHANGYLVVDALVDLVVQLVY